MLGLVEINCFLDAHTEYPITHTFWVYAKNNGRTNLLGMDFIEKQISHMNFQEHTITSSKYKDLKIPVSPIATKNYPMSSLIYPLTTYIDYHINAESVRLVQIPKPQFLKYFPLSSEFEPTPNSLNSKLLFYQTTTQETEDKYFPLLIENPTSHTITWRKGIVGFLTVDPLRPNKVSTYNPVNLANFVGALITELNPSTDIPTTDYPMQVSHISGRHESDYSNFISNETKYSELDEIDIKNEDDLYRNLDVLFAGQSPKLLKERSDFERKFNELSQTDQNFLSKFDLTKSQLTCKEKLELYEELLKNKECYSKDEFDLGTISQKFHVKLKQNAELRKQRPSKVPVHHREKMNRLLDKLEESGVIKKMGDDDNLEMGSEFINPIIILPKGDTIKIVLDARYLNAMTDLTSYSWPLEPLNVLLTRINGKYFTTSDLSSAYMQVPLTKETQRLVSFVIGDTQYMYLKGFYGLAGLPSFFLKNYDHSLPKLN
jgi:hypothetical protein